MHVHKLPDTTKHSFKPITTEQIVGSDVIMNVAKKIRSQMFPTDVICAKQLETLEELAGNHDNLIAFHCLLPFILFLKSRSLFTSLYKHY